MRGVGRLVPLAVAAALVLGGVVAGATTEGRRGAKSSIVPVKLLEFKVQSKLTSLTAGRPIKLKIKNLGVEVHEMVVVRTDGSPLPTRADGSVDEDVIPEADKIAEVENIRPSKSKTVKLGDLPAGRYGFFCNLVDKEPDGTTVSHYAQGMHTDFSVLSSDVAVATTTSGTVSTQRSAVRREYPAGGPTDPVFPPNDPTYELLAAGGAENCGRLLEETQRWGSLGVADTEGEDTTPLYMSAAYACLGRWDDAIRVFGQIHVNDPRFGETGHVCTRTAALAWVRALVDERRRDPSFSPVFVASSARSPCPASNSPSTDATTPPTSVTAPVTSVPPTTVR